MEGLTWKCLALIVISLCHIVLTVPVPQNELGESLSPLTVEDNLSVDDLDRSKRKLPEATFGAKNAILGYVFGKIDSILDAKTRLISSFDQTNIAKNKQYGIESPKPINSLQSLIQAVISPKIAAITSKFGALSGSSSSGGFGLSGGAGAGAGTPIGDDDDANAEISVDSSSSGGSPGVGGLLSSFLKLSGPILSSSAQSAKGGTVATPTSDDSDE